MKCFKWSIPQRFNLINREVKILQKDEITKNRDEEKPPQTFRDVIEIQKVNDVNKISEEYQKQNFLLSVFYTILERTGYEELVEDEKLMKLSSGLFHQVLLTADKNIDYDVFNYADFCKAFHWEVPDTFNLLDTSYTVKWKNDKFMLEGSLGEVNAVQEIVELQDSEAHTGFTYNSVKKTFLHEIMHHILLTAGNKELSEDEDLVDLIAGCWNQIFNTASTCLDEAV